MSKMNLCVIFSWSLCFLIGCGQIKSDLAKKAEKKLNSVKNARSSVKNKIGWNNSEKCFYLWQVCGKNDDEILLLVKALNEAASFLEVNIKNEAGKVITTAELCGLSFTHTLDNDDKRTLTVTDGQTQLFTYIMKKDDGKMHIKSTVSVEELIALLEKRGLKLKVMLYAEDKSKKAVLIALIPKLR